MAATRPRRPGDLGGDVGAGVLAVLDLLEDRLLGARAEGDLLEGGERPGPQGELRRVEIGEQRFLGEPGLHLQEALDVLALLPGGGDVLDAVEAEKRQDVTWSERQPEHLAHIPIGLWLQP